MKKFWWKLNRIAAAIDGCDSCWNYYNDLLEGKCPEMKFCKWCNRL